MKCEISTGGGRRNGDRRETKERKKKSCPALPQKIFDLCWFRFLSIILRFYMPTPTHHLYSKSPAPAACSMQVSATCVGCRMNGMPIYKLPLSHPTTTTTTLQINLYCGGWFHRTTLLCNVGHAFRRWSFVGCRVSSTLTIRGKRFVTRLQQPRSPLSCACSASASRVRPKMLAKQNVQLLWGKSKGFLTELEADRNNSGAFIFFYSRRQWGQLIKRNYVSKNKSKKF